jgi:hypothetical protein
MQTKEKTPFKDKRAFGAGAATAWPRQLNYFGAFDFEIYGPAVFSVPNIYRLQP